ncbi:MAG: hypothetical protein NTW86_29920, partial [Candidatus Sumerlaeota bacterium]|nr:hypothetical protein [Candidatus Sumerlaeota bacterium]
MNHNHVYMATRISQPTWRSPGARAASPASIWIVVGLTLFAFGGNAQTVTLNRPLGDFESVGLIGVTSDGQTAVYHVTYSDTELDPWHAKESIY